MTNPVESLTRDELAARLVEPMLTADVREEVARRLRADGERIAQLESQLTAWRKWSDSKPAPKVGDWIASKRNGIVLGKVVSIDKSGPYPINYEIDGFASFAWEMDDAVVVDGPNSSAPLTGSAQVVREVWGAGRGTTPLSEPSEPTLTGSAGERRSRDERELELEDALRELASFGSEYDDHDHDGWLAWVAKLGVAKGIDLHSNRAKLIAYRSELTRLPPEPKVSLSSNVLKTVCGAGTGTTPPSELVSVLRKTVVDMAADRDTLHEQLANSRAMILSIEAAMPGNTYSSERTALDAVVDMVEQLAVVTRERDEARLRECVMTHHLRDARDEMEAACAERDKLQRAYDESAQKADSHRRLYESACVERDQLRAVVEAVEASLRVAELKALRVEGEHADYHFAGGIRSVVLAGRDALNTNAKGDVLQRHAPDVARRG